MNEKRLHAGINILLYLIIFVFVNLILSLVVGAVVANIYNLEFSTLFQAIAKPEEYPNLIKEINITSSYTTLFTYLSLFVTLFLYNLKDLKEDIKSFKVIKYLIWIVVGFGILYGVSYLISYLTSLAGVGESDNQNSIVNMIKYGSKIGVFISVVICAPFAEEMIFRKSIGDLTLDKSRWLYYVVATVFFALPHMLSTRAAALDFILMTIPYLFSGLFLAFTYERTRNIYVSIGIHMLNNLLAFILIFV